MTSLTEARDPVRGASSPKSRARGRTSSAAPWVLLTPALILLVAFMLIPIGYSIWLSFRANKVTGGGLLGARVESFTGLSNYFAILQDPLFSEALLRMVAYGLIVVPIMFTLALVFALLLDHAQTRAKATWRAMIFVPYAVPGVIASLMWGFIYLPSVSPITQFFELLGLTAPEFLSSNLVLASTANIAIWGGTGFNMIIMYTALRGISPEIYEAAKIDGSSELQTALRIKIPLIAPALVMTMIFALIAMIQVYNEPTALKSLSYAITNTWMPMMKVYNDAFVLNNTYIAAAESVLLALMTLGISLGVMKLTARFQEAD